MTIGHYASAQSEPGSEGRERAVGAEHEAVVRGFLAAMEGERWDLPRIERMLSHMAPEARYHVYA